ncbi:Hsp33 family molecular chaperone HslO [Celerinatantimonas diazotrophica]|uniref:33 kDa chaperonin n=1 Tax=Celerinatantimonas diazotrophica TaxID=412034 RepID=A0A4R1KF25_9GAMM|nr:Hsp33 family molecular chaperone HslO [Celerinatantimonas diazotrophica]TCK62757.1 molecular chaperone Hsp33 [Celerinatantimonas diazotrophica]CAG9298387.1 33 kDa chaperonin [Celerinatantimonas diazotrophica]
MAQSDTLYRYIFEDYQVRAELVQLNETLQTILSQRDYPPAIRTILAELLAATSLLTATLKFEGDITVQLQGTGTLHYVAINGNNQQQMRGVARWDETSYQDSDVLSELVGDNARLVITIAPANGERYQGIVALAEEGVAASIENYFAQSEQLPTHLWLFFQDDKKSPCCAGLLIQQLPVKAHELSNDYQHIYELTRTATAQEIFTLPAEQMLYRLYHQEKVRLFDPQPVEFACTCSKERCQAALFSMHEDELLSICEEQGAIAMHCEFCGSEYRFDKNAITELFHGAANQPKTH